MGNCCECKVHPVKRSLSVRSLLTDRSLRRKVFGKEENKMMMKLRSCAFSEDEMSYEIRFDNGKVLTPVPDRLMKIIDEHYIDLLRSYNKEDDAVRRRNEILACRVQKARMTEERIRQVHERRYCSGKVKVYGQSSEYSEANVDVRRHKLKMLAAKTKKARQSKKS